MLGAGLLALAASGASAGDAELPGWMAGAWHEEKAGSWTEEYWSGDRAGQMLGMSRSARGGKLVSWEAMRIETDAKGEVVLLASPEGRRPTRFALASASANAVTFANPTHDYPQKIAYRRDGARLIAEISMMDGSRAMRWIYERAGF
ncbi:MAG: hypothetical protein J7498_03225 [Sphingobium sp.]|nr:hypothetical protein [Sphingobium sp.]